MSDSNSNNDTSEASETADQGKPDWKHTVHENDFKAKYGKTQRDMVGYGNTPVKPHWPRSAKVALNFVINYEEGGEMCVLHGDDASESRLSDNGPDTQPRPNERNLNIESMYEYGARCGFWRLHRLFTTRKVPVTVFGVGMALERNMEVVGAIKQQEDWEVSSHGYRLWDYKDVPEEVEKEHIERSVEVHKALFGKHPPGLYQGKPGKNTRKLAVQEGGFLYDSDAYNDDLPYWSFDHGDEGRPHLIIPSSLVENDLQYTTANGWGQPDDFLKHLKRTLDFLVVEGRAGQPKMMTVGLHCRLSRPARAAVVAEFVDYAKSYGREVWITTRESIANHWYENHMPRGCGSLIMAPGDRQVDTFSSSDSKSKGNGATSPTSSSSEAVSPSKRFAFLGNLKAPRGSTEFKESRKDTSKDKSDDEEEDKKEKVEDVI